MLDAIAESETCHEVVTSRKDTKQNRNSSNAKLKKAPRVRQEAAQKALKVALVRITWLIRCTTI